MKCSFTKHAVELERSEGGTIALGSVTFIDHALPFEDYLPKDGELPLRVDMVIGGDVAWKHLFSGNQLRWQSDDTAEHDLGSLWLGIQETTEQCEKKLMVTTVMNSCNINPCSKIRMATDD